MSSSQAPILTVSQLTQAIRLCLESTFPSVWLQGEISNSKLQSSGHLYFSLKDAQAQISAVMFRGDLASLSQMPKEGDQVIIRGDINVYPPTGKYQIVVRELRQMGLGALLMKLEELKVKLQKRGWFNKEHKKPLPKFPKRIGVVTSPTGAVIQDILHILTRRAGGFHLILNPVKVQGEGAAQEIAKAIYHFNEHQLADVLIVGRGGGSIEDLWAFNEEIVAEAIFNSQIPIISAVGHETDYSIADFVADVRAPTPSAAAELVMAEKAHQLHHLEQVRNRLHQTTTHLVKQAKHRLEGVLKQPLLRSPYYLLGPCLQKLDGCRQEIDNLVQNKVHRYQLRLEGSRRQLAALNPLTQLQHTRSKLAQWDKALQHTIFQLIEGRKKQLQPLTKRKQLDECWQRFHLIRKEKIKQLAANLASINPKNLLANGYCILFAEKDRSVITSINAVQPGDSLSILLADGEVLSTAIKVTPK